MKKVFLFFSLFYAGLAHGDDLMVLTQVLKDLSGEQEITRSVDTKQPTSEPCKILIVNDRGDISVLMQVLVDENKKRDGKLFSGEIDLKVTAEKLNDPNYKIIFLSGFREKNVLLFRHDGYFYGIQELLTMPLFAKRGCVVLQCIDLEEAEKLEIVMPVVKLPAILPVALPHEEKLCIPGCIQKQGTKFFGIFKSGFEFSEIFWPATVIIHKDMPAPLEELYSDDVKTIYDWLLWK